MKKLIFGCGYLGQRVAQRWRDAGNDVAVVTRSAQRAKDFDRQGYQAIVADVTRPDSLVELPTAETVLYAVGYDPTAGRTIEEVYAGGVQNVLVALPADTGRFIYISTTGVYGDAAGEWVDEKTPSDPQRDGGRASLAAESVLRKYALGERSIILRLAGIYGPGRIPFLEQLRSATPIAAASSGFLNLIHVDDAAAIVVAAGRVEGQRLYCVSDGHPVTRDEYYREVARRIGAPAPRFVAPEPGSPRATRAGANRKVANARILAELDVRLDFPDYRAGLGSILGGCEPGDAPV
jgi:nucleoside-diphosphate-sugar epimerase